MPEPTAATAESAQALYYLVAPSGFPNYGDELIAANWLRYLAEVAPNAEVWLDTHSPGPAAVVLANEHPRVHFTDTLWRLCGMAEERGDDPWQLAAWVQEVVHNPGMTPRWHFGIELLARADVVHVLGGGYINKLWPHHIGLLAGAVAATRRSGGRAAMTGQGLVPAAEDTEPLLRALAGHFEIVDVRDAPSAELLGVSPGLDDAFLGLGPHLYAEFNDDEAVPEVVLCLQSDLTEVGVAKVAGAALSMLREWKVSPEKVCVVEGIPRVDREVYALFQRELPGARFYPFPDVWRRGLPVSPSQVWISTRFHMHLVAAAAGASGVAISVHPDYYATKHRSLTALGSGWTVLEDLEDLAQVPERPRAGGFAAEQVAELQRAKLDLARSIYPQHGGSGAEGLPPVPAVLKPMSSPTNRSRWSRIFRGQLS